MQVNKQPMTVGRGLLGGLFTGILAAIVVMVFNVIYRGEFNLYNYDVVMPVSIFMVFPLINLVAGGLYFLFVGHLRRGRRIFILVALAVMVLLVVITLLTARDNDRAEEKFKGLLIGLELIEGLMAAILIPFLAGHPTLYMTDKDIRGEE